MWQVWSTGTSKQTLEKYKNLNSENSGLLLIRKWDFKTKLFMFNYLENLLLQNILPKVEDNIWDLYASSVIIRQHQNRHRKLEYKTSSKVRFSANRRRQYDIQMRLVWSSGVIRIVMRSWSKNIHSIIRIVMRPWSKNIHYTATVSDWLIRRSSWEAEIWLSLESWTGSSVGRALARIVRGLGFKSRPRHFFSGSQFL